MVPRPHGPLSLIFLLKRNGYALVERTIFLKEKPRNCNHKNDITCFMLHLWQSFPMIIKGHVRNSISLCSLPVRIFPGGFCPDPPAKHKDHAY